MKLYSTAGEILIEDNDIIGDDVNIAARIEPFSAPGGIAISNKVHDAIVRESEFTTKYLGKPRLKGVGQKVEVYCITSHGLPETILSDVSAKLENEGFQWNLKNTIGIAASIIGLFMLINFLFLRGEFTLEDSMLTSSALTALSFGLPAFILIKILVVPFFANEDTKTPIKVSIFSMTLNLILNLILIKEFLHVGLAIATSVSAWVNATILFLLLKKLELMKQ